MQYIILASNARGHGIHSPFVYEFISSVLNDNRYYYAYEKIERVKKNLLQDKRTLIVNDFGAGSSNNGNKNKIISEIADTSALANKNSVDSYFVWQIIIMPELFLRWAVLSESPQHILHRLINYPA